MEKESRGYLTVEATVSLTVFLFMMMFLMNMGQIYQAQNYVTHGLLQSGKLLSFNSYGYKQNSAVATAAAVVEMLSLLEIGDDYEIAAYWKTGQYEKAVRKTFGYCAGKDPADTERTLKKYGLKEGIGGIVFTSKIDSNCLLIKAQYQIELPFAFFGFSQVTLHQQVKCELWS